jgi:hypothetical protein
MATARVRRGRDSQEVVAERLRALGLVYARSRPAALAGADIENAGSLYIEVKAKEEARPGPWSRDNARKAPAGHLPFVIFRPNSYGPACFDDWPVIIRWADFLPLLHLSGYLPTLPPESTP